MEKIQAKGEIAEEELKALEMDMTGKVCLPISLFENWNLNESYLQIMLASWRGTRFEVMQVLREVSRSRYTVTDTGSLTPKAGLRQSLEGYFCLWTDPCQPGKGKSLLLYKIS